MVEPELLQALELLVAGRGCDHGRAGLLGELDRRHADAPGPGVDQGRLPGLQVAGGEQALLRRADRNRDARRGRCVQPVGDRPGRDRGDGALGRVRAGHVQSDHPVADRAVLDSGADLGHRAGGEIADDVRDRRRRRAGPGQQIAALDADRLDVDHHAAVGALGVGHVLVAQDLRTTVLVDHRGLHRPPTLLAHPR